MGVPKTVDWSLDVVIYEEIDSEGKSNPFRSEQNLHNIEGERKVVVETVDE